MEPILFNTAAGEKLDLDQVVQEVISFMRGDILKRYKITIGTDSQRLSNKNADFVSAIVVHRIGNGGRYFYRRFEMGKFHTLRDRIIQEVLTSLELGKETMLALQKLDKEDDLGGIPEWDFEIHIDVGENGETKAMIQEVVGMVRASNFAAITKPGSYAASNVADRYV